MYLFINQEPRVVKDRLAIRSDNLMLTELTVICCYKLSDTTSNGERLGIVSGHCRLLFWGA